MKTTSMESTSEDSYGRQGLGILVVEAEHVDKIKAEGDFIKVVRAGQKLEFDIEGYDVSGQLVGKVLEKDAIIIAHSNAYVNTGLVNALNREFNPGAGGTVVGFIGVSSNTTAVTASTVNLNGASGGTAANTIIKATTNTIASQTVTATVTSAFVNADFTSGVFIWNKIGLLNTSTDAGTGLIDVIGGTGGSSPYNRTFALDLTAAGTFSVVAAIAVTASAL